jgi:hypothetical protein
MYGLTSEIPRYSLSVIVADPEGAGMYKAYVKVFIKFAACKALPSSPAHLLQPYSRMNRHFTAYQTLGIN